MDVTADGDADRTANGAIDGLIGVALPARAAAIPTFDPGSMLALGLLLMVAGLGRLRRNR